MDRRDIPLWQREAKRRFALNQKRACEAAAYPHMGENAELYMESLIEQITERKTQEANRPTAEQEAEWAKNRADLLEVFGRKS